MVIKVNKKGYPKEYDTLFVDTETTGLYPDENDCIIQIAGFFMDKRGRVSDKFNFRMQPYHNDCYMTKEASECNGYTMEQIQEFDNPKEIIEKFTAICNKHLKKGSKILIAGYNVGFDVKFIKDWFRTFHIRYSDYFESSYLDVYDEVKTYFFDKKRKPNNFKQTTVYRYFFKKELNGAHDAMADIKASKKIHERLFRKKHTGIKVALFIIVFVCVCMCI